MSEFAQKRTETTSDWLKRLIAQDAPADVRADVRAILEAETRQVESLEWVFIGGLAIIGTFSFDLGKLLQSLWNAKEFGVVVILQAGLNAGLKKGL